MITKSGTNDYHGLIYDFERHSFIEANNWFNNRAGLANPSFKRHQFGANAGGPIVKNRTFFFGDYEGLRQGFPVTFTSTVPTELQKAGNFSNTLASDGTQILIYDPDTLTTLANGTRQRTPYRRQPDPVRTVRSGGAQDRRLLSRRRTRRATRSPGTTTTY